MSDAALVPRRGARRCRTAAGAVRPARRPPVPRTLVPVAAIVGTVARPGQFDRRFRPLTRRASRHAERIAAVQTAGVALPPVRLVRVGGLYFVEDGHHRVAAAAAAGRAVVAAAIRPQCTVAAGGPVTPEAAAWWAAEMEAR